MKIQRVQQISESHCGPAVLQMLLQAIEIEVSQEQIVEVLGIKNRLEEHGMRPDQLGLACTLLAPETLFWYKFNSSLDDVKAILDSGYAVGIEWQGLFYQTEEEEQEVYEDNYNPDAGHYSIITFYDPEKELLIIVDPYKDFANQDRIFDAEAFVRRWWDSNEVEHPLSRRQRYVTDKQLLFFVTPKDVWYPKEMGLTVFRGEENPSHIQKNQ